MTTLSSLNSGKSALGGHEFVKYDEEYLDVRGGGSLSKAQMILNFIKKHGDEAYFSTQVVEALKTNNGNRVKAPPAFYALRLLLN